MVSHSEIRPRGGLGRLLTWMLFAVAFVAGPMLPGRAVAQDVDAEVESLVEEASNHYDNLEIGKAREKLKQAIQAGQEGDASNATMASAYVMVGVVEYGAERKKDRALKAFKEAARLDPEATIPDVYQTPTLTDLMKKAKEQTEPVGGADEGTDTGEKREVDEFTHEPISSHQAGNTLTVEAFVPENVPAESVVFVFQRYDQEGEWQRVELEATNATRFAAEIPAYKIYTTQISYYIEVEGPEGGIITTSGSKQSPHSFTVLGNSDFDPEQAKKEYLAKQEETEGDEGDTDDTEQDEGDTEDEDTDVGDETDGRATPVAYLDIGGGTGVGFLTGDATLQPTANPTHAIQPGLSSAFAHTRIGGGYQFPNGAQLGIYLRFQFLPAQNFSEIRSSLAEQEGINRDYRGFRQAPCFGIGLPGDCLLGAKYRWFFSEPNPVQFFSSVGAGVGRVRHWLRLKNKVSRNDFCERTNKPVYQSEQGDFCYRADTVRPGWVHFGVGGGMAYEFSQSVTFFAESYLQVLFPNTALNLDINIGPQFRF